MAKITKEDIEHAGKLSRIKLSQEEVEEYSKELEQILDYVAELGEAPTENIETVKISDLENVCRKDEIKESLGAEKVLENAPDKQDNFIRVKKVFE